MSKPSIVYVGAPEGFAALVETAQGADCVHAAAEAPALAQALAGAHGLLDASMKVRIDDAMIKAAPNLQVISCAPQQVRGKQLPCRVCKMPFVEQTYRR